MADIALHSLSNQFTLKAKQMTAKLIKATDGINAKAHRKDDHFQNQITAIVVKDGVMKEPVILRIYTTSSKGSNTACLWVNASPIHCSGSGRATGYGYDRPSAATSYAITSAGFELSQAIEGRGLEAMQDAVKAIAIACGFKEDEIFIHRSNA